MTKNDISKFPWGTFTQSEITDCYKNAVEKLPEEDKVRISRMLKKCTEIKNIGDASALELLAKLGFHFSIHGIEEKA